MILSTLAATAVVINELMAANAGVVMSSATNFDSWIELYNPGDEDVLLDSLYLSDDPDNLTLWQIPAGFGSVPAKGYKVVWLGSNDINPNQAPFKLDSEGGSIYLSSSDDEGATVLCSADYPYAYSRTAWARKGDAAEEWSWTHTATPGYTNDGSKFAEQRLDAPVMSKGSCLFDGTLTVSVDIPEGATLLYTTDGSLPTEPGDVPGWIDYVVNGNCEGDDATSLVSHDANGDDVRRIVDGVGFEGSRGIHVHTADNPQNSWDAQFFVYTPGHVWSEGERYRFSMKVRADKPSYFTVQSHTVPHTYIASGMFDGMAHDVGTEWTEFVYEGIISGAQVGKETNWWTNETTVKDMQTLAFNLSGDTKENNFYFDDVKWELSNSTDGVTEVSKQSLGGNFTFNNTTVLTVRLFQDGFLPSVPVTCSYIKTSDKYTLPVVAIAGDKRFFTDPKIGIDCDGDGTNGAIGNGQNKPKNYNQPWDRPVNFSYISPEGNTLFSQDVNISVSGGWTRSMRFRSFKLKSNKVFDGLNRFDYAFFPQKPYTRNKTLLLRNGGNDVWKYNSRLMDPALETIILRSGLDVDVQSYVPVIEYVNGQLRGVLNLREPNNDKFAYANFGYADDEIDAFENFQMKNGNDSVLKRIFELGAHINADGAYDELKTLLDIDEFTNYMAVTLFLNNDDWPGNNVKAYRSQDDGRYRFVSFDLDYAFAGCYGDKGESPFTMFKKHDSMDFVQFFLNLLGHDGYRRKFTDTFCIVAGSVFEPSRASAVVDELLEKVQPMTQLMIRQGINDGHEPERAANAIKTNLKGRSEKMTTFMKLFKEMKLSSTTRQNVTLKSDTQGACLFINGTPVPNAKPTTAGVQPPLFDGHLFAPVMLEAKAPAGYTFAGWRKGEETISEEPVLELPKGDTLELTATFVPLDKQIPPVRINEVSANNSIYVNEHFKRGDWVELYNTTSEAVDVTGMYLSDEPENPQKYQIAGGMLTTSPAATATGMPLTVIPPHGCIVVWCDKQPSVSQLHAPFKLNDDGGELLLTAADSSWTDRFVFTQMKGDETEGRFPDGTDSICTMNVPSIAHANSMTSYSVTVEQPVEDGIHDIAATTSGQLTVEHTAGEIVVTGASNGPIVIDITNMGGQHIATHIANAALGGRTRIHTGRLKAGAYIAIVTDSQGKKAACKFF